MRIVALLEHSLPVPQWTPTVRQFSVLEALYMITKINIGPHFHVLIQNISYLFL